MVSLGDAYTNIPSPGPAWRQLSDAERLTRVVATLHTGFLALDDNIVIAAANRDGQILVSLLESIPAGKRGTLLLDIEATLKETIDPGLVVWLEPLGDRNSLRNLRGIEVKA